MDLADSLASELIEFCAEYPAFSILLDAIGAPSETVFFFQEEDGIRDGHVTGVQTCALPICAPMGRQIDALKAGAQIVAGTPGRVLDHIRRGTFKTDKVKMLILDECDEMLSMGFMEEIEKILAELPPKGERQTLLFSATIPEEIER